MKLTPLGLLTAVAFDDNGTTGTAGVVTSIALAPLAGFFYDWHKRTKSDWLGCEAISR